jgi:hypothetical protein
MLVDDFLPTYDVRRGRGDRGCRRTLPTATMRTATTDEHSPRWFRRYWTFGVGCGASVLAAGLVEAARERAER